MSSEKVNENRPQKELRSPNAERMDSPDSIRRGGGEDPRRYAAKIAIDRVVRDNDISGYNHNATSSQPSNNGRENEMWSKKQDVKAVNKGTPMSDGTYRS
jgi:hypothetical protein